jgi:hypothetical protein
LNTQIELQSWRRAYGVTTRTGCAKKLAMRSIERGRRRHELSEEAAAILDAKRMDDDSVRVAAESATRLVADTMREGAPPSNMTYHTDGGDAMELPSGNVLLGEQQDHERCIPFSRHGESKTTIGDRDEGHGEHKYAAATADKEDDTAGSPTGPPIVPPSPGGGVS